MFQRTGVENLNTWLFHGK